MLGDAGAILEVIEREISLMRQRAYDLAMRLKGASDRSGLLENAVEWLALLRADGKIVYANDAMLRSHSVAMASELPAAFLISLATKHDAVLNLLSVPSRGLAMHR